MYNFFLFLKMENLLQIRRETGNFLIQNRTIAFWQSQENLLHFEQVILSMNQLFSMAQPIPGKKKHYRDAPELVTAKH